MAPNEHPIGIAAIAVAGTIGICSLIVSQWIVPTVTASWTHENSLLKEKLSKSLDDNITLKKKNEKLVSALDEQKKSGLRNSEASTTEIRGLKDRLFQSQMANMFLIGDPYPVGLDKIRIGDPKQKVFDIYPHEQVSEVRREVRVKAPEEVFRRIDYVHSITKANEGRIGRIQFGFGKIDRILDKSLPKIPDGWLEATLRRVLDEPFIIGQDNDCLLWKNSDSELVYYRIGADWFEVSGLETYPAGCSITDEQVGKIKSREKQRQK